MLTHQDVELWTSSTVPGTTDSAYIATFTRGLVYSQTAYKARRYANVNNFVCVGN